MANPELKTTSMYAQSPWLYLLCYTVEGRCWMCSTREVGLSWSLPIVCIYVPDWFCILPDLIGPSSSKLDSFKNNKNKIPEPSNRCFQMFRFIFMKVLWKSISIYTLYFCGWQRSEELCSERWLKFYLLVLKLSNFIYMIAFSEEATRMVHKPLSFLFATTYKAKFQWFEDPRGIQIMNYVAP